jgi:hypothetical protein
MTNGKCALTTSCYRGEGLGSQMLCSILPVYCLARRLKCYYLFTPLEEVRWSIRGNGTDAQTDQSFNDYILKCLLPQKNILTIKGWARYQRLYHCHLYAPLEKEQEIKIYQEPCDTDEWILSEDVEYQNVPNDLEHIKKILRTPSERHRVLRIADNDQNNRIVHALYQDYSLIADLCDELSEYYRHSSHPPTYFSSQNFNIAIHIRKHVCPPDYPSVSRTFFNRNNSVDQFYCLFVKNLSNLLSNRSAVFHIYSHSPENEISDYDHFSQHLQSVHHQVMLHINEPPITTFHHFIMADLFLMGDSAMSQAAHFYSKGHLVTPHPAAILLPKVHSIDWNANLPENLTKALLSQTDLFIQKNNDPV